MKIKMENLNEQINKMRKLMGLNEGYFDNPLKKELDNEYNKLNKEYIRLDKSLDDSDTINYDKTSNEMEAISLKMAKIANDLENLEN